MKTRKLKKRIKALEKIISINSVTLTSPIYENVKVVMHIEGNNLVIEKIETTDESETTTLSTINLNQ